MPAEKKVNASHHGEQVGLLQFHLVVDLLCQP